MDDPDAVREGIKEYARLLANNDIKLKPARTMFTRLYYMAAMQQARGRAALAADHLNTTRGAVHRTLREPEFKELDQSDDEE